MYAVHFSDVALKKLKKMDPYQASLLISWIEKNLQEGCQQSKSTWKGIGCEPQGQVALIEDEKIIITIIDVGHRKDIYE